MTTVLQYCVCKNCDVAVSCFGSGSNSSEGGGSAGLGGFFSSKKSAVAAAAASAAAAADAAAAAAAGGHSSVIELRHSTAGDVHFKNNTSPVVSQPHTPAPPPVVCRGLQEKGCGGCCRDRAVARETVLDRRVTYAALPNVKHIKHKLCSSKLYC